MVQKLTTPTEFLDAAAKFASGVTILTTRWGSLMHGITASAFTSLSLSPPQVLVCVANEGQMARLVAESGVFAVNVLAEGQGSVSRFFATRGRGAVDHFEGVRTRVATTGAPVIENCLAYFDCRLVANYPGGDHRILVGQVLEACGCQAGRPLLYFDRDYRRTKVSI